MDNLNNLTYCSTTTNNHKIASICPQCVQKINAVCIKDGAKHTCFTNEVCLNIDDFETFLAQHEKRDKQKTMDFSFGVNIENRNEQKMILVELRLNYTNWRNISKKELDDKINHSKVILGHSPIISNQYYFVFKSDLKQQAHNHLRRLYLNRNFVFGVDLNELKNNFFQ